MEKYLATIDGGQGGETDFWADNAAEALSEAIAWAVQGDWTYPAAFRVCVVNEDDANDSAETVVELDDEPRDSTLQ